MKTVRLTTCASTFEAHCIKGQLESEGICCVMNNEIMSTYPPLSGVDIFVNEEDLERAKEIISNNKEE